MNIPRALLQKEDPRIGRLGGRVIIFSVKLIRYAQDCSQGYGRQVRAFQIDTLTTKDYVEHEIGTVVTDSGAGWNKKGMPQKSYAHLQEVPSEQ